MLLLKLEEVGHGATIKFLLLSKKNNKRKENLVAKYFFILKQPITCMDAKENSVVITKVDVETFNDFLGLINRLAEMRNWLHLMKKQE